MKPKKSKNFNPSLGPLRLPKQLSENDKQLRDKLTGNFLFPLGYTLFKLIGCIFFMPTMF